MTEESRKKAILNRNRGPELCEQWGVLVVQARYSHEGHWYARLSKFPAALVDQSGFLRFETEEEYAKQPGLTIKQQLSIRRPGISKLPGYVRKVPAVEVEVPADSSSSIPTTDLPAVTEGRLEWRLRRTRERSRTLIESKIRQFRKAHGFLYCEICMLKEGDARYPEGLAGSVFEVHHIVPMAQGEGPRRTLQSDLLLVCGNCHNAIHATPDVDANLQLLRLHFSKQGMPKALRARRALAELGSDRRTKPPRS